MRKSIPALLLTGLLALGAVGCASHTGEGALLGGATGAALGAAIGSHSHQRAGEGALLGAAIGAIGGGLIGNEADRQEKEYAYDGEPRGGGYYDGRADYGYEARYERRYERPRYSRRYYRPRPHDCPPGYYESRSYRYGRGGRRYYETTYYEYD